MLRGLYRFWNREAVLLPFMCCRFSSTTKKVIKKKKKVRILKSKIVKEKVALRKATTVKQAREEDIESNPIGHQPQPTLGLELLNLGEKVEEQNETGSVTSRFQKTALKNSFFDCQRSEAYRPAPEMEIHHAPSLLQYKATAAALRSQNLQLQVSWEKQEQDVIDTETGAIQKNITVYRAIATASPLKNPEGVNEKARVCTIVDTSCRRGIIRALAGVGLDRSPLPYAADEFQHNTSHCETWKLTPKSYVQHLLDCLTISWATLFIPPNEAEFDKEPESYWAAKQEEYAELKKLPLLSWRLERRSVPEIQPDNLPELQESGCLIPTFAAQIYFGTRENPQQHLFAEATAVSTLAAFRDALYDAEKKLSKKPLITWVKFCRPYGNPHPKAQLERILSQCFGVTPKFSIKQIGFSHSGLFVSCVHTCRHEFLTEQMEEFPIFDTAEATNDGMVLIARGVHNQKKIAVKNACAIALRCIFFDNVKDIPFITQITPLINVSLIMQSIRNAAMLFQHQDAGRTYQPTRSINVPNSKTNDFSRTSSSGDPLQTTLANICEQPHTAIIPLAASVLHHPRLSLRQLLTYAKDPELRGMSLAISTDVAEGGNRFTAEVSGVRGEKAIKLGVAQQSSTNSAIELACVNAIRKWFPNEYGAYSLNWTIAQLTSTVASQASPAVFSEGQHLASSLLSVLRRIVSEVSSVITAMDSTMLPEDATLTEELNDNELTLRLGGCVIARTAVGGSVLRARLLCYSHLLFSKMCDDPMPIWENISGELVAKQNVPEEAAVISRLMALANGGPIEGQTRAPRSQAAQKFAKAPPREFPHEPQLSAALLQPPEDASPAFAFTKLDRLPEKESFVKSWIQFLYGMPLDFSSHQCASLQGEPPKFSATFRTVSVTSGMKTLGSAVAQTESLARSLALTQVAEANLRDFLEETFTTPKLMTKLFPRRWEAEISDALRIAASPVSTEDLVLVVESHPTFKKASGTDVIVSDEDTMFLARLVRVEDASDVVVTPSTLSGAFLAIRDCIDNLSGVGNAPRQLRVSNSQLQLVDLPTIAAELVASNHGLILRFHAYALNVAPVEWFSEAVIVADSRKLAFPVMPEIVDGPIPTDQLENNVVMRIGCIGKGATKKDALRSCGIKILQKNFPQQTSSFFPLKEDGKNSMVHRKRDLGHSLRYRAAEAAPIHSSRSAPPSFETALNVVSKGDIALKEKINELVQSWKNNAKQTPKGDEVFGGFMENAENLFDPIEDESQNSAVSSDQVGNVHAKQEVSSGLSGVGALKATKPLHAAFHFCPARLRLRQGEHQAAVFFRDLETQKKRDAAEASIQIQKARREKKISSRDGCEKIKANESSVAEAGIQKLDENERSWTPWCDSKWIRGKDVE